MGLQRRGWVTAVGVGSPGNGRNATFNGRRQPLCGGTSRMMRQYQVRNVCERLGVNSPGRLGKSGRGQLRKVACLTVHMERFGPIIAP
jgi:hypothetical protein